MLSARTFLRSLAPAVRSFSTSAARANMAKVTIIGRLASDPELVKTNDGKEYMRYSVGSSYKQGNEYKVSWFRIVSFESYGKAYLLSLKKGTLVYVEGNLKTRVYEAEGKSHLAFDIWHRHISSLSKPKSAPTEEESQPGDSTEQQDESQSGAPTGQQEESQPA